MSQNHFNRWYFGNGAGIDFNAQSIGVLVDSKMTTDEGCSVISDSSGALLFYTNGMIVWNKNHDTLKNGFGLFGDRSSTQSALIVQLPKSKHLFYIFTTDGISYTENKGVCYSIVDMSLNNGLGEVIKKNELLFKSSNEKITAVKHKNNSDVWIATLKRNSDSIFIYKLNEFGLDSPIINRNSSCVIGSDIDKNGVGQLKFSSDGNYLAYSNASNLPSVHIMDFNAETGILTRSRTINRFNANTYGIEFSPNCKYLYVSTWFDGLYQYPIDSLKTLNNFDSVGNKIYKCSNKNYLEAIQLAPNGKIYIANFNQSYLASIEQPDSFGFNCKFSLNAIDLKGRKSYHGLPSFVQSDIFYKLSIKADTTCCNDTAIFRISNSSIDSVFWNFGDGDYQMAKSPSVWHIYKKPGIYKVEAKIQLKNGVDTFVYCDKYVAGIDYTQLGKDTTICNGDTVFFDFSNRKYIDYIQWEDGSNQYKRHVMKAGMISVFVSNTFCKYSDTVNIKYAPKSSLFIGNDTAFCQKFSKILDAGKGYNSYIWNTGSNVYKISVNTQGKYFVNVVDSFLCNSSDTINLSEILKPIIIQNIDTNLCQQAQLKFHKQSYVNYLWNSGDTSNVISVTEAGNYVLTSSNQFCLRRDTVIVNFSPKPKFNLGADTGICGVNILTTNEKGAYIWNTGQTSPNIYVNRPGTYILKITRNHCEVSDTINLFRCKDFNYFIPDAFTPNGDNINEGFKVFGIGIESIKMDIYNAWGQKVFSSLESCPIWDGTYMNQSCPQGVYLYSIEIIAYNKQFIYQNGLVNLLR